MTKVRDQDKFMLRLPDGMREKIAADAKVKGRSMNAEIVARIANSVPEKTLLDEMAMSALNALLIRNSPEALLNTAAECQMKPSQILAIISYEYARAMIDARGGDRD